MKNWNWKSINFWILIAFIIVSILIALFCCSESKCWKAFVLISTISVTAVGAIYQAIKIENVSETIKNIGNEKLNTFDPNSVFELYDENTVAVLLFERIKELVFPLDKTGYSTFKIMKDEEHLIKCEYMPFEKGGPNSAYEKTIYPLEKYEKNIKEIFKDNSNEYIKNVLEFLERMKYIKKENEHWILDETGKFEIFKTRNQELKMQKLIEETMEKYK